MHSRSMISDVVLYAFVGCVLFFLAAPILLLVTTSFSAETYIEFPPTSFSLKWYEAYFTRPEWHSATWMSLKAAVLSSILSTVLGVLAAYGLRRLTGRTAKVIQAMLIAPMVVPVITMAIGIFYLFAKLNLVNTLFGLVLAHAVISIPLVVITVGAAMQQFDMALESAAMSLGASRARAFLTVTLPTIKGSVMAGLLLAFVMSLDEVVIALFITAGDVATLPRKFFTSLRDFVDPTIAAISCLLILVSAICMVLAQIFRSRTARGDQLG